MMSEKHIFYMQKCLDLAVKGLGRTKTNPLVGSVIVHEDKIIGEGFHEMFGGPHAEVNAIRSVKDPSVLPESTLYVNLEPCSHYGKTPPCANLIIEQKIGKVVIGAVDTYSEVNGKGIEKLRNAGIEVITGVLENECRELNRRFYTFHERKRPYIILKWAESSNGKIDIDRSKNEKNIHWITQPETQGLTHQWRSEEMGILVGRKTVETDNPSLTARIPNGQNPTRIVLDSQGALGKNYAVFDEQANTLHLTNKEIEAFNLKEILHYLYENSISSIIVEGGKNTLERFLSENLWDEARILEGTEPINDGSNAPRINLVSQKEFYFGKDLVKIYRNFL